MWCSCKERWHSSFWERAFSFFWFVKKRYFNKVMPKYPHFSSSTLRTWTDKAFLSSARKKQLRIWADRITQKCLHFGAKLLSEVTPACLILVQPWQGSSRWASRGNCAGGLVGWQSDRTAQHSRAFGGHPQRASTEDILSFPCIGQSVSLQLHFPTPNSISATSRESYADGLFQK